MQKTAYLHIGLPKTATTSFQSALYRNRGTLLSAHGMLYPSVEENHTNPLCAMFLDNPLNHITLKLKGINRMEDAIPIRNDYFRALEEEIETSDFRSLVLSAEGVSNLNHIELENLGNWVRRFVSNVQVIFWARHPLGYTRSVIQQIVKGGGTIEELEKHIPLPNFTSRLSAAIKVFGKENIRLKAFEDAMREPGGAVAAFCRDIDLPEARAMEIAGNAKLQNASMSMLATLTMSRLNTLRPLFVNGTMHAARRRGEVAFFQMIKGEKFEVSEDCKTRVYRRSCDDVAWLNQTFGTSHYLDVVNGEIPPKAESARDYDLKEIDSLALVLSNLMNSHFDRHAALQQAATTEQEPPAVGLLETLRRVVLRK